MSFKPRRIRQAAPPSAPRRSRRPYYGGLHVLHNNAGGSTPAYNTVVEAPIDEFWCAIRLDLFGTCLGCRFGILAVIASGGRRSIEFCWQVWPTPMLEHPRQLRQQNAVG